MGGSNTVSRRAFFSGLKSKTKSTIGNPPTDDPLFEKYSRKRLTPRIYKTAEVAPETFRGTEAEAREGNVTSGLAPYTGVWTEWEVLHLRRRTGYNLRKSDIDSLLAQTPSQAIDSILTVNPTPPPPPVNWYNNVTADEAGIPYGADITTGFFPASPTSVGQTTNNNRQEAIERWLFGLATESDGTIREKMTWFWYHFIPVDFDDIRNSSNTSINLNSARFCYQYFQKLRAAATGNFKNLILTLCLEPAMMFYLNNNKNTNTAPDENFARELMELFTLGKDPASQYTQADVIAAAKVLTGWVVNGINTANTTVDFTTSRHTTGTKTFSPFFNNVVIPHSGVPVGSGELAQFIDLIFSKDVVVSEYICRRLYRYFVYYDIDANIEANVIVPLAQTFRNSNWEILPVLKQLFKSEHFFDAANLGVMIKSPVDLVASSLRSFGINLQVATPTNYEAQYKVWNYFNNTICFPMEQKMGNVPNVSGWVAYYQTPAFHEYWINSNTIQKRAAYLTLITNGFNLTYASLTTRAELNNLEFVQQWSNTIVRDPNAIIAKCIQYLLPVNLSVAQQVLIKKQTLLSGQTDDSYWTTAWDNYVANPTNTSIKSIVTTRLKSLMVTLLQLAEYQLM